MDNYSLNDVKKINENKLLTDEILKKIILSVVRRVDIYNDYSEIEILKYLRSSANLNQELICEIDNYLYKFEGHVVVEKEKEDKRKILLIIPLILMIVLIIYFIIKEALWI